MKGVRYLEKIRKISLEKLKDRNSKQVAKDLRAGRYSLLESIGCHDMRAEMKKIGFICRLILWVAEHLAKFRKGDYSQNLRRILGKFLKWGAPYDINGCFPHLKAGIVVGFNHPTLGEILRLLSICVLEYPDRKYLFPVNIVWYEELAPVAKRMEVFGLYITPTITPATREKMEKYVTDPQAAKIVDVLTKGFNMDYLETSAEFARNGDILMIAPSATRQATVFQDPWCHEGSEHIEPQTMTLIAMNLIRSKTINDCIFLPVSVAPPRYSNRRLNLFRKYLIISSGWLKADTVKHLCAEKNEESGDRKFEHFFLLAIADELLRVRRDDLVEPS